LRFGNRKPKIEPQTVFISYRKSASQHALAVYQALYGPDIDAFADIDGTAPEAFLFRQIEARSHFVLLLTPAALEGCVNDGDPLRTEIEHAIATKRSITPVTFEGFEWNAAKVYLTGGLSELAHHSPINVPDGQFNKAMRLLQTHILKNRTDVVSPAEDKDRAVVDAMKSKFDEYPLVATNRLRVEGFISQAKEFLNAKRYNEALAAANTVVQLQPKSAAAYYSRGAIYALLDDYDRTIADCDRAIRLDPHMTFAYIWRAYAVSVKGDYARAIADYTTAIVQSPTPDGLWYCSRGLSYNQQGDQDAAIADFNESLRINPEQVFVHRNRGIAYERKGALEDAIADYSAVIRLEPASIDGYILRRMAAMKKGDYKAAVADNDVIIRLDPKNKEAYLYRGYAYTELRDYNRATEDFSRAIEIDPAFESAYNYRGYAYSKLGDYTRALADLSEAIRLFPTYLEAFKRRATVYRALDKLAEAEADEREAERLERESK
jgi:tetratricopeptide (TPR) repeat protein